MSSTRHKLVVRNVSTNGIYGIQTLNGTPQPLIDDAGNIDMSSNFLKVKNIEAGIQEFTTNGDLGIINVFNNSTGNSVSCINFKHDRNNIGGNNRRYCSFDPSNNNNTIAGSITGNTVSVSYNTMSDSRLKNVSNTSGNYMVDALTNNSYSNWLSSVNALKPCVYLYKSLVGDGNQMFTYTLEDGTSKNVMYQGFLAHEIQSVYPPAVTGISGETINVNGVDEPVYQQVDMTKLIPMMVGAIKELTTTVNNLTTTVDTLTTNVNTLSARSNMNPLWNIWTIIDIGYNNDIKIYYTNNTDHSPGLLAYIDVKDQLTGVFWGVNQLNTQRFTNVEEKGEYLAYQLGQSNFASSKITPDMRFIYDFDVSNNQITGINEYSYKYYTKANDTITDLSVNNTTNVSANIALIYELDESVYNTYQIMKSINIDNFRWFSSKVGDTSTTYYSAFSNETNSLATFYNNIQPNLLKVYWGISQYNTTISDKKTYLYNQMLNNNLVYAPVENYQFIYDFSMNVVDNVTTYIYSYYTIISNTIQDTSFNGTDPSGTIGLIYDTSL